MSVVYANDAVLRDVYLTDYFSYESNFLPWMKQNGTRLENKTPRETTNVDRKNELKNLLEVCRIKLIKVNKVRAVSSVQWLFFIESPVLLFHCWFFRSFCNVKWALQNENSNVSSRPIGLKWFLCKIRPLFYDVPPLLVSTAASRLALSPAVERAKLNEIRK